MSKSYEPWSWPPPNPYGRISDVAERLGVKPHSSGPAALITGNDGRQYDVFDVVIAFLDFLAERAKAEGEK